jgi:hypothetical protein
MLSNASRHHFQFSLTTVNIFEIFKQKFKRYRWRGWPFETYSNLQVVPWLYKIACRTSKQSLYTTRFPSTHCTQLTKTRYGWVFFFFYERTQWRKLEDRHAATIYLSAQNCNRHCIFFQKFNAKQLFDIQKFKKKIVHTRVGNTDGYYRTTDNLITSQVCQICSGNRHYIWM